LIKSAKTLLFIIITSVITNKHSLRVKKGGRSGKFKTNINQKIIVRRNRGVGLLALGLKKVGGVGNSKPISTKK
jgi:hypothetical protein